MRNPTGIGTLASYVPCNALTVESQLFRATSTFVYIHVIVTNGLAILG